MHTSRRGFMQLTGTAALTAGAVGLVRAQEVEIVLPNVPPAEKKLNILILGGTGFLGPHVVWYCKSRGHNLTLFNRGNNKKLFQELEQIHGNRDPDIDAGLTPLADEIAAGRRWDVVIDTSAYVQRIARASAELFKDATDQYLYISSICAYKEWMTANGGTEELELDTLEDETDENVGQNYCQLQAICEREFTKVFPDNNTVIRPGLIVGPRDFSGRFTYWPIRIERGGDVLAPGRPTDPIQWIDVRDLARFIVVCCETKAFDDFNACGPESPSNMAELMYGCKAVTGGTAEFIWIDDDDFLTENGINAWAEVPLWASPNGELGGVNTHSNAKAIAAGLTCRPLADTVRGTLDYYHAMEDDARGKRLAGMSQEKETEVLAAWSARNE